MDKAIQAQQQYIDKLLTATPYNQRVEGLTFLNLKRATLKSAGKGLRRELTECNYNEAQIDQAIKDCRDIILLETSMTTQAIL